ncbi:MAG: hypothetical protein LQ338_003168 [Usnochroma carphineum]|nr:MAG: hypothetical protein LQ338_003168 [Usnochroma carphineum]
MSDNLSTSSQDAAVQADNSATEMGSSAAKVQDQAKNLEETQASSDADQAEADTTGGKEVNDAATQAGKGTKTPKTSPKKRATAGNDDEDTSPKKKRAPAKAKAAKPKANAKDEHVKEEEKTPEPTDSANDGGDSQVAATPSMKGKRAPAGQAAEPKIPRTPKTPKNNKVAKGNATPTSKATPRKRSAADKVADKVSIPGTWAEASEADKELVAMKKQGSSWNEIRAMWLEKTGQDTATSTLPNQEEKSTLLNAKEEIEANWKTSKWAQIADAMVKKGANKYPAEFLMKEWKKLEAARVEAANTAAGGEALLAAVKEASQGDDDDDGDERGVKDEEGDE